MNFVWFLSYLCTFLIGAISLGTFLLWYGNRRIRKHELELIDAMKNYLSEPQETDLSTGNLY
jgi:hypothetical protein